MSLVAFDSVRVNHLHVSEAVMCEYEYVLVVPRARVCVFFGHAQHG